MATAFCGLPCILTEPRICTYVSVMHLSNRLAKGTSGLNCRCYAALGLCCCMCTANISAYELSTSGAITVTKVRYDSL